MRPTMSAATAKFDTSALFRPMTGHGGGIIMGGGGDGEGHGGACVSCVCVWICVAYVSVPAWFG